MVLSVSLEIYNISVLDLKPHWVTYHSRFHGGCGVQVFSGTGFLLDESARCSPAWWQRCFAASAYEQGGGLGYIGFRVLFILLGFSLRDFAAHSDGASPADVGVVFSLFILDCMVMYIILLLFYLLCDFLILFI
jgi:hypothetical protein